MQQELQVLGLTQNEAKVYEALVQSGSTKAGQLIARLDVHRNIIYEALESLIRKGFVTKISKRGVWWFQITEPDSILTMLKRREQVAEEVIKEVKHYKQQVEQQITVYEGLESFRAYWLSTLERFPEGTVDYCLGVPDQNEWMHIMGESAFKKYTDMRRSKKMYWKTVLFSLTQDERKLYAMTPELIEYRLWPQPCNPIGNFNVIGDTVILQVMKPPTLRIIEIRDKDMVTVFKNYFDAVWAVAEPVKL